MNTFLASGDGPFYFPSQLSSLSWLPQTWNWAQNLGSSNVNRLWYDWWLSIVIKFINSFGLGWFTIDKLLWSAVFIIAITSSYIFAKNILRNTTGALIASLVYSTNTYILMLFGGGQYGVALAYSFAPYVFDTFTRCSKDGLRFKNSLACGLALVILTAFDLRAAIVLIGIIFLYILVLKPTFFTHISNYFYGAFILLIAGLCHLFWIVPSVLYRGSVLTDSSNYTGPGIVKFLSFADFTHAISLLHPNWPDNIFGKVYFMQPEFLVVPVIAFISLIFLSKVKDKKIFLFFGFLGLVGAFLAKGENGPFGEIFHWLFVHFPGFVLFRDPTKFYLLTAISYSILIPFSIFGLSEKVRAQFKTKGISSTVTFSIIFIMFWFFTLRPLFFGQLSGNFRPQAIPTDYQSFEKLLSADQTFSRTLWLPQAERFSFANALHPAVDGNYLFNNASLSAITSIVSSSDFSEMLSAYGIRYVVVPADYEKRIFLTEYVYDDSLRQSLIRALTKGTLQKVGGFNNLIVYENPVFEGLVSFTDGAHIPYTIESSNSLSFAIAQQTKSANIYFNMAYDPGWVLSVNSHKFAPQKTSRGLMQYVVSNGVSGEGELMYLPQKAAEKWAYISAISFVFLSFVVVLLYRRRHDW